jgi:hypothetical protein
MADVLSVVDEGDQVGVEPVAEHPAVHAEAPRRPHAMLGSEKASRNP